MRIAALFRDEAGSVVLAAFPATALVAGLGAMVAGRDTLAGLIFTLGVLPVIAALLKEIVTSLSRGDFGLDIIALISMTGAVLADEALAGAVVALMYAGGRVLESIAQGRAQREMTALLGRVARTAQAYRDGRLVETAIEALGPGDRLLIRAGEVVPADGKVAAGVAVLDESALTGEPLPVTRVVGEPVASGVANAGAPFDLTVERGAADSTYAGIVRMVDAARRSKAPMARLADRYALGFLALTLALAGGAYVMTDDPRRALAVLVVATPCPLILAVPVAIVAGMSRAAKRGLLVKSARTLERLARIRTVLFDKTGTVTDGRARLTLIEAAESWSDDGLIRAAASLAQASQHVISRALVAEAIEAGLALEPPRAVTEAPGDGLAGEVGGSRVVIGRPDYVATVTGIAPDSAAPPGSTVLAVAIDGRSAGRLVFADQLRGETAATFRHLRDLDVGTIVMLTGDQAVIAEAIAAGLGLDAVIADATPGQKVAIVKRESKRAPTLMVGDGINDAPALAAADVGVALGARGAAAASEAADLVVLVDRIDRVAEAVAIAKDTRAIALQSVAVGLGLSLAGMVAAAFGFLTPLAGALLQEAIDVAVVLNALRALGGRALRRSV